MRGWLERNATALGAFGTLIAGIAALLALVGIWAQIRAADHAQALQTARSAYLAQQALAVANPGFAQPEDACALLASDKGNAYEAYVTHLLFTAEQVLAVEPGWEKTFLYDMQAHAPYLCSYANQINATDRLAALVGQFTATGCDSTVPICER